MDDWSEIFAEHGALVWAVAYRILGNHNDALDCCQNVFTELLSPSAAHTVRNWPAFLKWLTTRRAIDCLRRRRTDVTHLHPDEDITVIAANTSAVGDGLISAELIDRLKLELARLPQQQAEAFWLLAVEELSYEEISGHLGVEANHVGVLVHRARQRLREWLSDLHPARVGAQPIRKTV